MNLYLISLFLVIIIAIFFQQITNKIGVPMLVAFLFLGMVFGQEGLFKINFNDYNLAYNICSVALILIIFYGGFNTRISAAKKVLKQSIILASLGVIMNMILTGALVYLFTSFSKLDSFLIGAVLSSTDAAAVFSILRSKKLSLKENTDSLLEIESGSNDPASYMLTIFLIYLINNLNKGELLTKTFLQIGLSLTLPFVFAFVVVYILKKVKFSMNGFDTVFMLSVSILSFAIVEQLGGNGYLSTYIVGIVVGNSSIRNKKTIISFFDGLTSLSQIIIFFTLGLLSIPSELIPIIPISITVFLVMLFIARPIVIFSILSFFDSSLNQKILVSISGLRGVASIVFAMLATVSLNLDQKLYHIVFGVVFLSILIQGMLLPYFSKKLNMIDDTGAYLKSFNDYSSQEQIEYIQVKVEKDGNWENLKIKNLNLPRNILIVLIKRKNKNLIPNGEMKLLADDLLIISARSISEKIPINLYEMVLDKDNEWVDKKISEIDFENQKIIVLIKRNELALIPNGSMVLKKDDILVIQEY